MHEIYLAYRVAADLSSFFILARDLVWYRLIDILRRPQSNKERVIRLRGGTTLRYRLNIGDIFSLKEVWLYQIYRCPMPGSCTSIVDLGANIGLASVWLAKTYGCTELIAVEPVPANATLAESNLVANGVRGSVLRMAVGPQSCQGFFSESDRSNLGSVARTGTPIAVAAMEDVFANLHHRGWVDLVKIDIEGAEEDVLSRNLAWLDRVRALLVEFHSEAVRAQAVERLEAMGFQHDSFRTAIGFHYGIDFFVRTTYAAPPPATQIPLSSSVHQ